MELSSSERRRVGTQPPRRRMVSPPTRAMLSRGARIHDYEVWGRLGEGGMSEVWLAKHTGSSTGQVEVTVPTREEALTKMRDELQYRIEWCPCSGASGDTVELQVREEGGRP